MLDGILYVRFYDISPRLWSRGKNCTNSTLCDLHCSSTASTTDKIVGSESVWCTLCNVALTWYNRRLREKTLYKQHIVQCNAILQQS